MAVHTYAAPRGVVEGDRRSRQRRRGVPRRQEDVPSITALRILLVSADLTCRLKYSALFEEAGFHVYAVSDSIEALKTISLRMPDLVVLGAGASGPDSFRLLAALRGDVWTSDVPAVVLTSTTAQAAGPTPLKASGTTLLLKEDAPAHVVLGAIDELAGDTPVERFARRQLRRTLVALRSVVDEAARETAAEEPVERDVARWAAIIRALRAPILGINAEGGLVAASRGLESLTGYAARELTVTSVFDSMMGTHLPFASIWQAHNGGTGTPGTTTIRDKAGRTLKVAYLVSTLTPYLHVLLLAPAL